MQQTEIWDASATSFTEDKDGNSKGTKNESMNLITSVIKEMSLEGNVIATKFRHE